MIKKKISEIIILASLLTFFTLSGSNAAENTSLNEIRAGNLLYTVNLTNELILVTLKKNPKQSFDQAVSKVLDATNPGPEFEIDIGVGSYTISDKSLGGISVRITYNKGELRLTSKEINLAKLKPLSPSYYQATSNEELINYTVDLVYKKAKQIGSMHKRSFLTIGDFKTALTKVDLPSIVKVQVRSKDLDIMVEGLPSVKTNIKVTEKKIYIKGYGMTPKAIQ